MSQVTGDFCFKHHKKITQVKKKGVLMIFQHPLKNNDERSRIFSRCLDGVFVLKRKIKREEFSRRNF